MMTDRHILHTADNKTMHASKMINVPIITNEHKTAAKFYLVAKFTCRLYYWH